MITLEQFLKKYLGKSIGYPAGSYVGECLSIVKQYIKECFGIEPPPSGSGSAYGYWSNFPNPLGEKFEKIENTPTLIPQVGWIVIWKPWSTNQYGHIAIIKDGDTNRFVSYDQNWGTKNFVEINHTYKDVVGFLVPKQVIKPVETNMTDEQKRILDFIGDRTEGDVRQAFGALEDISKKDKQISDLLETNKNLVSKVDIIEAKLADNLKTITNQQSELLTANENLQTKQEELDAMTVSKNQYKNWYEASLSKQINKLTKKELISYLLSNLFKK